MNLEKMLSAKETTEGRWLRIKNGGGNAEDIPWLLAEVERLREALKKIADQKIEDDEVELDGDFEGAYEHIVIIARAALERK